MPSKKEYVRIYSKKRNDAFNPRGRHEWTDAEEEYLIKAFRVMTDVELATNLRRTPRSIGRKVARLREQGRLNYSKTRGAHSKCLT